jgi:hypothetical protein
MGRVRETREPMDYVAAVTAHRLESDAQHNAEKYLSEKSREAAECEREYREALARTITTLQAEGKPATVARDLARGDKHVAGLQMKRNIAEGLREAAAQSIWRHTANRRDLEQFIDWSKRASFLDSQVEHR